MTTSTLAGCTEVVARARSAALPAAHPEIDSRASASAARISLADQALCFIARPPASSPGERLCRSRSPVQRLQLSVAVHLAGGLPAMVTPHQSGDHRHQ